MNKIESNLINIPVGKQAHHLASQLAAEAMELVSESTKKAKGKQVYLNSLAVYAVDSYLQWQGYETNNSNSDFGNVIVRSRLDVADIFITGIGKLECRFLWSEETSFDIPTEVTEDRIGYVAVQVNNEMNEATLLGFYPSLDNHLNSISINALQSVDDFIDYLYRLEVANSFFDSENDPVVTQVKERLEDIDIYDLVLQLEKIYRLEADTEKPYAVKDMLAGNIISIGRERETSVEEDDFELMELAEEVIEKLNQIWSDSEN